MRYTNNNIMSSPLPLLRSQSDQPLPPMCGKAADHLSLSVADLDPWMTSFKTNSVKVLEGPHKVDGSRAVIIEGPSPGGD